MSNDVDRRLKVHNEGKGARFTRSGRPWVCLYRACIGERGAALKEEARIKKLSRAAKFRLISG